MILSPLELDIALAFRQELAELHECFLRQDYSDFLLDTGSGKLTRLTKVNDELFSQLDITAPEEIWYTSFDGKKIQGWIQKPPDFDPHKQYPLILDIHGGPHAAYGWVFDHEFQWMAAKGYVVFYPNPRGSTSYGQDFANIIQYHYPGDDYRDLMMGVDELIKRGYIDAKKLAVTGGSGGGVLTNWTVTHTDRFAAAMTGAGISNWLSDYGTADIPRTKESEFFGSPWESASNELMRSLSPITYASNVKTPTLFVHGEADMRVPITEERIRLFAEASDDFNPVHMDEAFASKTAYRGRIAHGLLLGTIGRRHWSRQASGNKGWEQHAANRFQRLMSDRESFRLGHDAILQ